MLIYEPLVNLGLTDSDRPQIQTGCLASEFKETLVSAFPTLGL